MKTLLPFLILLIVPTFGLAQVLTRAEALEQIEKRRRPLFRKVRGFAGPEGGLAPLFTLAIS